MCDSTLVCLWISLAIGYYLQELFHAADNGAVPCIRNAVCFGLILCSICDVVTSYFIASMNDAVINSFTGVS